jgi:hypothetical protein
MILTKPNQDAKCCRSVANKRGGGTPVWARRLSKSVKELNQRRAAGVNSAREKRRIHVIETAIVLVLTAVLTGVLITGRIFKGKHARQNDDLRLHLMRRENRQNQ